MNKLTPKQEKFCKAYIETGNASEAYRKSYSTKNMKPATINRRATELMANGMITARVDELNEIHQKRHEVTVDSLTAEYEEARKIALKSEQPSAMVSATTGKAKLHGLVTDKTDNKNQHTGAIKVEITPEKIKGEVDELFAEPTD